MKVGPTPRIHWGRLGERKVTKAISPIPPVRLQSSDPVGGIHPPDIRIGQERNHRPGNQVPVLSQGNGEHRLEVEDELAAIGRGQIAFLKIHIALGGDVPDGTDGVVELLADLLHIIRGAGVRGFFQVSLASPRLAPRPAAGPGPAPPPMVMNSSFSCVSPSVRPLSAWPARAQGQVLLYY